MFPFFDRSLEKIIALLAVIDSVKYTDAMIPRVIACVSKITFNERSNKNGNIQSYPERFHTVGASNELTVVNRLG